ncbi:MAG: THUMP domain-containing protein [Paludibacter sp.]|nr:THUMP domain-containing protein [Paludibacter sp.]
MNQQPYIAKTFKGLEEVLATELIALGADNIEIQRRAVAFTGDKALLYKANLQLRTAIRILMPIATFRAGTTDEIYEEVKKINWTEFMDLSTTFAIDATVFSEELNHSKFVAYRVKDGIVDWFKERFNNRPSVKLDNPQLSFNVHVAQNRCTISLDSSGESLHKRGYRVNQTEAPISEALAAGMLLIAGWKGQSNFLDPFCGSGTFLIEAALIALNIPPGLYRPSFGFEHWKDFDKELFDDLYQDDSNERPFDFKIYGSDISRRAIEVATENIKSAGLGKYIELQVKPVAQLEPPAENCLIVTNPPYGERLNTDDIAEIYSTFGTVLKHKFAGSSAWVISSEESLLDRIGLKPAKKVRLLNGALDCLFNRYDIFSGKRKEFLSKP